MRTSVRCGRFTVTIHRSSVHQSVDRPRCLILRVHLGRPRWLNGMANCLWQVTEPLASPGWIDTAHRMLNGFAPPEMILDYCRDHGFTVEMETGL